MWHKFISDLSSLWSRLWPYMLSGAVGSSLTAGFLYFLKRRDERRELRKKLTAEIYLPARRQLKETSQAIQSYERPFSIYTEMWKPESSSRITKKLKPVIT